MRRLILLMLFPLFGLAQKAPGTIYFLDGTSISGTVKVTSGDIKYWASPTAKPDVYDYGGATGVSLTNDKGEQIKYEYVYFDFRKTPLLLKVEKEGYLTLYSDSSSYYAGPAAGMPGGGMGMGGGSTSTYYLKKKNDKLGQWYLCFGYISKINFTNVIESYFKDCKAIQDKYANGEFRKKHYMEIVDFYNQNCAPK